MNNVHRIGHYRIVGELGRGGMGVVYKAHEESLNRFVALKVLGEHLAADPSYVARFVREAQSAAALSHPNIVQIHAIDEDDGRHYFAMEYVEGTSLQQILRADGRMEPRRASRIVLQAAAGLAAAHEQGVVHRDIKPANILIDRRGLVKIADFGLALLTGAAASRLTASGMFMGTPGYLSPEQCLDADVDHRTDIYSLGVTFYEMLTGSIPFSADSPLALIRQIIEVAPPDVSESLPEVDADLREIVGRMMAKNREDRFSSADEVMERLESWLEGRGVAGELVSRIAAGAAPADAPTGATTQPVDDRAQTVVLPDEPPTADAEDVATVAPPPPPPPAATAAAASEAPPPAAPVPEPITAAPLSSSRPRGLLIAVVLIVVLGLAALVAGGLLVWRTDPGRRLLAFAGIGADETTRARSELGAAAPGAISPAGEVADAPEESRPTGAAGLEPATPDDEPPDAVGQEVAQSEFLEATTAGARARTVAKPESDTGTTLSADAGSAASGGSAPRTAGPETSATASETSQTAPAQRSLESPSKPPVGPIGPPPTGVVVLTAGEPLLAGEVEAYVEEALGRAGVPVVDERTIPGARGLVDVDRPFGPDVVAGLRSHARFLVFARAEYTGERPLRFMNRRDVAYTGRLTVTLIDLAEGHPAGSPIRANVEYNQRTVERVVAETLRPRLRELRDRIREER